MRFKLACRIPRAADTTSFYRARGPLSQLRHHMDLECYELGTWDWSSMVGADAIFMQRPYSKGDVGVMEMAKRYHIPVWVDYDDFLFDLTTDNPAYWNYMKPDVHNSMAFCLKEADVVTVTTPALQSSLKEFNKNVVVIPNAWDMKVNPRPEALPKRENRISWRGSATHHRDVFEVCQTIFRAHKDFKETEWHFFGDNLWLLTDNMVHEKTFIREPTGWDEYLDRLYKCAPAAMVAPLHASGFNLCKSNIAWIEAAWAGAVTIAPKWPEWRKPGVLCYETEEELYEAFRSVILGQLDVGATAKSAWEYVCDNLDLRIVNKQRAEVLSSLRG